MGNGTTIYVVDIMWNLIFVFATHLIYLKEKKNETERSTFPEFHKKKK